MKKLFRIFLLVLIVVFLLVQFYPRGDKNVSGQSDFHISKVHTVPTEVEAIFKKSCYDCHSNHTDYPWYASIQPVSWWLDDHISEGKKELNFSEFAKYNLAKQYRKLEEINGQVKENEMPLKSYTIIHTSAKLNSPDKNILATWVEALRDSMAKNYPPDSLIRKKK